MKVTVSKATAEGEMIVAEMSGSTKDGSLLSELNKAINWLDARMVEMNGRIIDGMKLQRQYPPAVQKAVMDVMNVVYGRAALADTLKVASDPVAAEAYAEFQAEQDAKGDGTPRVEPA